MNALKDLLVTEELGERERCQQLERLENLLERFKQHEIPIEQCVEVTLQDPLLLLLAQHRSFRICRRKLFCPEENCRPRPMRTVGEMALHMQREHGASQQETTDMVQYLIARFLLSPIKVEVKTAQGKSVKGQWDFRRCRYPRCNYSSSGNSQVDNHISKAHQNTCRDTQDLGVFWGAIQTMMRDKPETTIAEALGQGTIWECQEKDCHRIFAPSQAVHNHFSKTHAAGTLENWEPKLRCVHQQWKPEMGEISESEHKEKT
jgi:hypothetical protein